MTLDLARPISSLCELAGVTLGKLARARGFAAQSLKDGPGVGLATIAAHAAALGMSIRVVVESAAPVCATSIAASCDGVAT